MVGTFAQPDGVLIDPVTLKTLGNRELVEGMGEVIKYGLIDDIKLWHILEEMDGTIDSILDSALAIIYHSCQVKRKHVLADQYDKGLKDAFEFWPHYRSCDRSTCWLWRNNAWRSCCNWNDRAFSCG